VGFGAASPAAVEEPWVLDLEPFPEVAGAVAAERPALELDRWSWH
jgi:hypothetical protein